MSAILPTGTKGAVHRLCSLFNVRCSISRCVSATTLHRQHDAPETNPTDTVITRGRSLPPETNPTDTVITPGRSLPLVTSRKLQYPHKFRDTRQAWLEGLSTIEDEKLGIVDLHPEVFGTFPRLDIINRNIEWQRKYKYIDYRFAKSRAEMRGGGRKPWPQKGTGRARHGSIRSPIWKGGGAAKGPRGPTSHFYMLSRSYRERALRCMLSVKYAQDDLHIVESLDIPTDDPEFIQDLIKHRNWGLSVLFIDDTDLIPRNFALALDSVKHFNVMPVYGLNVYSMLKHETLVLTLAAAEKIEEKLLYEMHKPEGDKKYSRGR